MVGKAYVVAYVRYDMLHDNLTPLLANELTAEQRQRVRSAETDVTLAGESDSLMHAASAAWRQFIVDSHAIAETSEQRAPYECQTLT